MIALEALRRAKEGCGLGGHKTTWAKQDDGVAATLLSSPASSTLPRWSAAALYQRVIRRQVMYM